MRMARNRSEETTSVGRKCRSAKVDLPEPEMPLSTTKVPGATAILSGTSLDTQASVPQIAPGEDYRAQHEQGGIYCQQIGKGAAVACYGKHNVNHREERSAQAEH